MTIRGTPFMVPIIIMVLMIILFFVIVILGWINGSTPPLGGNGCIAMNNLPDKIVTSYNLNAKSVLSDSSYILYSDETDNLKNIGVWNLLEDLVINPGEYSIDISGQIFLDMDYQDGQLSYDVSSGGQSKIDNLKKGDMIGVFLQNDQCLKTSTGGSLCDGQNIAIYNNNLIVKNYPDSFQTLGSININGPAILAEFSLTDISSMTPIVKNLLSHSYDFLPILINQDGSLYLNLYQSGNNTSGTTGSYIFSVLKYGGLVKDNVVSGQKGQVQFAFRNDNEPANWVSNGIDNTPLDQVTTLNSSSSQLNASTQYSKVWVRILDDDYNNNMGNYLISVSQKPSTSDSFSKFISNIYQNYSQILLGSTQSTYTQLIKTVNFTGIGNIKLIQLLSVLYVTIYGIYFTLGLTRKSQEEFLGVIVKLSLVNVMFSDQSWNFFSEYFFNVFIQGPFYLIDKISAQSEILVVASGAKNFSSGDMANQFAFLDRTLGLFYSKEMLMVVIGFLSSPPVGWVITYILIYMIFNYTLLVLDVVAQCFTSIITTTLMIAIFPVFLALIFFGATKDMVSKITAVLAEIYIRIFILFTGLKFLQQIILVFFGQISNFDICWQLYYKVSGFFTIYAYQPPYNADMMTKAMQNVLCFYVICELCRGFVQVAMDLSSNISNSYDVFFQANRSGGGGGQMISEKVSGLARTIGLKPTQEDKKKQKEGKLRESINRHIDRNSGPRT